MPAGGCASGSAITPRTEVADNTLPSVSGINWGDAPTWGAVFVGAVAGTAALIQLRQQGNVFKGEVERNKRRDELLDGQLRELERRETSRRREQAERIDVTWNDMAERPGKSLVVVINGSHRPVREVTCTLYDAPEGEPFEVEYAIELLPASFPGGGFVFREMPGRREWMIGAWWRTGWVPVFETEGGLPIRPCGDRVRRRCRV